MRKYLSLVFVLGLVLSGVSMPAVSSAQGTECINIVSNLKPPLSNGKVQTMDSNTKPVNEVSKLQRFLYDRGYYPTAPKIGESQYTKSMRQGIPNSSFGGVNAFQRDYGLLDSNGLPDGYVGTETRNHIRVLSCASGADVSFTSPNSSDVGEPGKMLELAWTTSSNIPSDSTNNLRVQIHSIQKGDHVVFGASFKNNGAVSMEIPSDTLHGEYKVLGYLTSDSSVFGVSQVFRVGNLPPPPLSPALNKITGPSSVIVNQSGTWMIDATDDEGLAQLSYYVNWGDNTNSGYVSNPSFSHTYTQAGSYELIFQVKDSDGYETEKSMFVDVTTSGNRSPKLVKTGIPSNITVGKQVDFNFSASDEDGDNISWVINWGNGASYSSEGVNPTTGKNIFCPATKSGKVAAPIVSWSRRGIYKVYVDLRDCKGGFQRTELEVKVTGPVLNTPVLNTEISTPSRNIAVPKTGLKDGSRVSYNFKSRYSAITIREIEYAISGGTIPVTVKSMRIGKISGEPVQGIVTLKGLKMGVPAGDKGLNITAYLSYNGVGVGGIPSGTQSRVFIRRVAYTHSGGVLANLNLTSELSPMMTLVAPFQEKNKTDAQANALGALESSVVSSCENYTMTLRLGMDSNEVKCMREALSSKGYEVPSATLFDESVVQALKSFQSKHYLTPDGVFGSDSQAVLVHNL
ncbi:MAG: peptidoglycan-binding protein [Patescibacteria group bacterium]